MRYAYIRSWRGAYIRSDVIVGRTFCLRVGRPTTEGLLTDGRWGERDT